MCQAALTDRLVARFRTPSPGGLAATAFLLSIGCAFDLHAEPSFPELDWHGLLDLRFMSGNAQNGELQNGLGKFRYGTDSETIRINEAAASLKASLNWDWSGFLTIKYANRQQQALDVSEGFFAYRPVPLGAWNFNARLGMFFPPISLENSGTAWSSPYTLNSSVINAWVGQELRSFGAETRLAYRLANGGHIGLFAAGIANNDTAGLLLAWRGWSLSDYEATLHDRLRLPVGVGITRHFPKQAAYTRPFVEIDGNAGYYAGLTADLHGKFTLRALYYDNLAEPTGLREGQYAWHTRFWSLSVKTELPGQITLISQGLQGSTEMGETRNGFRAVDAGFWAASLLLSKSLGPHRLSLRHEYFGSGQNDFMPQEDNREHGYALTANYNVTLARRHQFNLEFSRIVSNRPSRLNLGQPADQQELLWQFAYRVFF